MFARDHKTATIGEEIFPLEMGYLPEFFKKKGEYEIRYTPNVREKNLRELKERLRRDNTFSDTEFTDDALLLFLNSRKYDLDRTVLQITKYLNYRNNAPHLFTNISFQAILPGLTSKLITPFPWRCQDGCAIATLNLGNWDPEKHPVELFKQMYLTMLTQLLRDPMTQVNGIKAIIDLNADPYLLRVATPQQLYKLYCLTEKVLPLRIKEYHLVNMRATGRVLWHVMKLFFSEKVKKRVHVHKCADNLLEFFPKSVLPVEYGGDLKDYDMTEWLRKVTSPEEIKILNILSN